MGSRRELIKQESTTIFLAHSNAHTIVVSLLVILFTIVNNLNIIACSRIQDSQGAGKHHHHHHHNHHHQHAQHHNNDRRHQRAVYLALDHHEHHRRHQQQEQNLLHQQQQRQQQLLRHQRSSRFNETPAWLYQQDQPSILDQCCACDEAKYELVFEGLWSKYTHPDDFPENYWLAYFSDIIGASHSNDFRMWDQDVLASEGVRELAETGSTKRLESELKQVSSKTRTIIKARELRYPTLNSKTSAVFRTDRHHHLVSVLSKLGPSPDWMVGVSGLELCQADCSWTGQRIVNLYLWDAGTDSGDTFTAPDAPTRPQERIRPYRRSSVAQLSSQTNATMRSLFETIGGQANGNQAPMSNSERAMLQFGFNQQQQPQQAQAQQQSGSSFDQSTLGLQSSEELGAAAAQNQATMTNFNNNEAAKPFARLTVTRQRIYEKSCNAIDPITVYNSRPTFSSSSSNQASATAGNRNYNHAQTALNPEASYEPMKPPVSYTDCRFTDWTDWSSCSSTCGKGIRTRTRSHLDDQADLSACSKADLIEKQICLAECLPNGTTCVTHDWSDWSPCSIDCGQGYRKRTRSPIGQMKPACGSIELVESEQCTGSCDQETAGQSQCAVSEWSEWSECPVACGTGTKIRFRQLLRKEEAKNCNVKLIQKQSCTGRPELCKQVSKDTSRSVPQALVAHQAVGQGQRINPDLPVIDCKLSNWSPWSTCSAVCGNGRRTRSRYIIQMPQNGGKPCDKKLARTQRCKDLPPCPQGYNQKQTGPDKVNRPSNSYNNQHHQPKSPQATSRNSEFHRTTTTTTTSSSMLDDEDEGKFSRLLKSELGHVHLVSWTPTEPYVSDGLPMASTEMELIGSSSFQIKNGFVYPFGDNDRRSLA